ncbi:MAG: ribonuclease P protein component [Clostridium sp.]|jgi:ribonuclease P protein component|nr:ribonuclease P protein component [Clostridium sp.]
MKNINSLKNSSEFKRVYQCGKSFANKNLVMYVLEKNDKENRLGISVSKKVGNSVIRHHVTRLIRESYRLHKGEIEEGFDIVVVARVNSKTCNYWDIERSFLHLLKLHHIRKEVIENTSLSECHELNEKRDD